jgi:AcrR family transcriptional regulator
MPKRVDHEERRQQIADALLRTAAARGLHATGMREVAAEAGVSLRLVQYYFGTKEELLLAAMQHLAARFAARATARFRNAVGSAGTANPRDIIAAILAEGLPADDERHAFHVIYTAYLALSLTDPALAIAPLVKNSDAVINVVAAQLRAAQIAGGTPHLDPDLEAFSLIAMSAGLATSMLAGQSTAGQAQSVIDYHLDRLFPASRPALRQGFRFRRPDQVRHQGPIRAFTGTAPAARQDFILGDQVIGDDGFTVPDSRRCGSPRLNVLDHLAIELVHRRQHGLHERPAALASRRAGVAREGDGEGTQLMRGVFDEQSRVLSRFRECPGLPPSALPGSGRLNAHLSWCGFQLPDKPVDTRCRPAFAWRRYRHSTVDQACAPVGRDLNSSNGARDADRAQQLSGAREFAHRFLQILGGIAKLSLRHHGPHANAKAA